MQRADVPTHHMKQIGHWDQDLLPVDLYQYPLATTAAAAAAAPAAPATVL